MEVKNIRDVDFLNYKKTSLFIAFPKCSFKCEMESGIKCCQNTDLVLSPTIDISLKALIESYLNLPLTHAIVCGGLEPFDSWEDLYELVVSFREVTTDDIVIYTGYYKEEIQVQIDQLKEFENIIIKFGRFIPNQSSKADEVLGVTLASPNQYTEKIS